MQSPLTPQVQEIVLSIMEGLRCPRSLTVAIMLRAGMWHDLLQLDVRPSDYLDPSSYLRSAAATKLLSKLECKIDGLDPAQAALDKWYEAEKSCFVANRRINLLMDFESNDPIDKRCCQFLAAVKKQVEWLIGDRPPSFVEGAFGPGATISDKSGRTTVLHKLSSTPTYTTDAVYHLVPWSGTAWSAFIARHQLKPRTVRGNHYFQVPKNAKTHRSCAKEPSINAFYQRGYGKVMSARLARRGIVISPISDYENSSVFDYALSYAAPEKHKMLTQRASQEDTFATIDLSSASDTISLALVRSVLPHAWFDVLSDLRSPYTRVNGKWHRLEKFSSMGNGFTFELETTIFAAICLAVDPTLIPGVDLMVFGDDIIVPKHLARSVINALEFCGFTLNAEKTFTEGPFRESCGGDYMCGKAVRPYHIKELPNEPQQFIGLANGILRLGSQDGADNRLMADLRPAWFRVLDCIPRHIRALRGPPELGDLVIHDEPGRYRIRYRQQKGWIKVYRPIRPCTVNFNRFCEDSQWVGILYGVPFISPIKGGKTRLIPMRGPVEGYKVGWVSYG